jgi:hypothetical protein
VSLTAIRLTLRLHRDVLLTIAVALVAIVGLASWTEWRLDSLASGAACPGDLDRCGAYVGARQLSGVVLLALGLVPIAGVILGVPILAQEFERSTIVLAWSLEPSRWRWFLHRLAPILVFALVVGVVAGVVADRLEGSAFPVADPNASFHDYGLRGAVLVGRLMLALGCAVVVGGLLGRILPSLIVASVICGGSLLVIAAVNQNVLATEASPTPQTAIGDQYAGLQLGFRYQLPSGELVTYEDLEARYPDPLELDRQIQAAEAIVLAIPPERYAEVSFREGAATGALGAVFLLAAVGVVTSRRPDHGAVRLPLNATRRAGTDSDWHGGRRVDMGRRIALIVWPHRLEFVAPALVGLAASIAVILVVVRLVALAPPTNCLADVTAIPLTPECSSADPFLLFASDWGNRLFAAMTIVPWLIGSMMGVVIVGREVEDRTATLAWSLSPDRRRWLLPRFATAAGIVVVLLLAPAVVSDELQRIGRPWVAPEATFDNYGLRGFPIVVRGLAALGIGLLAGACTGRALSAFLVTVGGCVALALLLANLLPYGVDVNPALAQGFRGQRLAPGVLGAVELREAIILGALTIGLALATIVVVGRRRPY